MEPARIPLLLRVVVIQRLRFPGRSSARPAAARCASYGKGRKIYSPLRPRAARVELGLRVDCEPSVVAAASDGASYNASFRCSPHVILWCPAMFGDELGGI